MSNDNAERLARELVRQFFSPYAPIATFDELIDNEKYKDTGSLIVTWGMKRRLIGVIRTALNEAQDMALELAATVADKHWPESGHVHQEGAVSCQMSVSVEIRRLKRNRDRSALDILLNEARLALMLETRAKYHSLEEWERQFKFVTYMDKQVADLERQEGERKP
jgi:hypothetical protein